MINVYRNAFFEFKPRNLDRFPRLDTVLMVEKELFRHKDAETITRIWRGLPKKVMWTTFVTILDYLEYSGKIHVEEDKTITWLWNPALLKKVKREGVEA
ncbi:MAG: hypothetical protein V1708_01270 [Candidatus Micrarchaeota archaeon]